MSGKERSKTQRALDLLRANPGVSQYAAAKAIGIHESVVSRAVRREAEKLKSKDEDSKNEHN